MTLSQFRTGVPILVTVFHGAESDHVHLDPDRGVFFSSDPDYAASYGSQVSTFEVSVQNPLVVTENEANGLIEIDRNVLLAQGHDGRIVEYDDGNFDVVCFEVSQARLLGPAPGAPAASI